MLTSTFIHAQGVGAVTERRLWEAGILTWADFLRAAPSDLPLSTAQRNALQPVVEASTAALESGDHLYFAQALPGNEQWRAVPQFMDRVGFLDIETDGGYSADSITIIGVYNGDESRIYVKNRDLDQFLADMPQYALWITFFGTGFDVPFLRRRFPSASFDQLHVDLCPLLRRLGYRGGLKSIEFQLGISREDEVSGMSGMDAVHLWQQWRVKKNKKALDLLIQYNRADIENLSMLLAFAYGRMKTASGFPAPDKR